AHAEADSFLSRGPPVAAATTDPVVEAAGTVIGPYKLIQQIGGALLGQKKFSEAEPLLFRGYEGMHQWQELLEPSHGSPSRGPVTDALERLVQLYDTWGRPAEAAKWREELQARRKDAGTAAPPKAK